MKKAISIIKEKRAGESRVILTPREVRLFVDNGFRVFVERGAGENVGITDASFEEAGAQLVDTETAWNSSKLILKYKPPTDEEIEYLNEDKVLGAVFHAEGNPSLINKLMNSGVTAFTYEFFRTKEGIFPLSVASSEIAGKVAVIYGAYHLQRQLGGEGVLLAPVVNVQGPKVLVIGYGNAGGAAARLAVAMGGQVTVLGTNREKLRAFQSTMSQNVRCLINSPEVLEREIVDADLVIGAILISTYDTPPMVTEELVKKMKKGSMIVDVTAGYGSGFLETFNQDTTFEEPVYEKFGVLHCKIDVLPLAYPITTVDAMSQHLAPYLLKFAESVYDLMIEDATSQAGKIVEAGKITHPEVLRHYEHGRV